ncbi:hypothetical protein VPH35_050552 [Triticum aestivum]
MGSSEFEQAKAHLHVDCAQPPAITWQRKFDDEGKKIPLIFKMLRLHVEGIAKNQVVVYDPLRKWMDNCYRGVPLGGLGSGSIGRSYRGYFQQFQIFPGIYEEKPVLANQFSAFVSHPGGKSYSTVLKLACCYFCQARLFDAQNDEG